MATNTEWKAKKLTQQYEIKRRKEGNPASKTELEKTYKVFWMMCELEETEK